ncbi:hypothetical protein G7046_g287 [Stylonectria norvegica]|nr:hypothetical protein G7046_g287 [Stylonectria norvegica]
MLPQWSRLWALLCMALVFQLASAQSFRAMRRQDDDNSRAPKPTTTESESESKTERSTTKSDGGSSKTAASSGQETTDSRSSRLTSKTSVVEVTTTTDEHASSTTATSTIIQTDGKLDNSTWFNVTIPAGELPLAATITPGWGIAGVIMLLTGIAHTLIGIKNRATHTFFSTAYVAALGITVLIVYVMNVPVSNALQGGYVAAIIISGCGIGAASMFFRELTEGLGCALGGFCVSMWLLCLVPGGLLRAVASKAIFIACFTLGGFAFYFSHYTRDWALILMIAFSGATITVLGIDCFSRAGLKEFWAYVWNLNNQLFPLGADTYPVTKGIRVETAAIIIIFLIGIVSQIKLWKIVREQRVKRAEEAAEGQRNLQEEEEDVGRDVEERNAREIRQWERVYGEGDVGSSTIYRGDSENGDTASEKKLRSSHTGSSQTQQQSSFEVIELRDMAEPDQKKPPATNLMTTNPDKNGQVTVRIAADDAPNSPAVEEVDEKSRAAGSDGQTLTVDRNSRRVSQRSSFSQGPDVVPLPFRVPVGDDTYSIGDRSSVATFADDEDARAPGRTQRNSFAKRLSHLSTGSANMIRSLSQRSGRVDHNGSSEDLVIPRSRPRDDDDDDGSVAATVDNESLSADERLSVATGEKGRSIEITAELSDKERPSLLSPSHSDVAKLQETDVKSTANESRADLPNEHAATDQTKAKSTTSAISTPASLTKDRLPRSLSRVAMSYRTNEWAKHLSQAEAPQPDELKVAEPAKEEETVPEKPAPVHVEQLQQAVHEGTPPPAMTRSESRASIISNVHTTPRHTSRQNLPSTLITQNNGLGDPQTHSPSAVPTSGGLPRSSSAAMRRTSAGFGPIAEERDAALTALTGSIPEEDFENLRPQSVSPGVIDRSSPVSGVVSYDSPQTLLGQREMYIRSKSYGNLLGSTQDLSMQRAPSEAGSLHNYPMYAAALSGDLDDLPLSQRKQMMRQSSFNVSPSGSTPSLNYGNGGIDATSPETPFDSHQPKRSSTLPNTSTRELALANFRQSVAHDIRSGTPVVASSGRETPFAQASLLSGGGREAEVQRNIELNRNMLLGQKEADGQRREMQRREKEWADRAFDERMRSGDLLEAHREAMRKMQKGAKGGN